MCRPCTTAAECDTTEPTSGKRRGPNQLEELTAIGQAMADAALVFDQSVLIWGWNAWEYDGSTDGTKDLDGYLRADAVKRAAVLCHAVVETLTPHFPPRFGRPGRVTPETNGNVLRDVAEQMDLLGLSYGLHEGLLDDLNREYLPEELFPHLLRDRSTRNPAVCPLCGSKREAVRDGDTDAFAGWLCRVCSGDVKKAKRVLKSRRVDEAVAEEKRRKKERAKEKVAPATAPDGGFTLPLLGVLDLRTQEERERDDAAAITIPPLTPPPPINKPKSKPKPRREATPKLHNRLAGVN